jgi:outer membrane murein-binding lipoprotein Lpp
MLAILGSKFGAYGIALFILILVVGGIYLHMRAEAATIIQLNQQVTLLSVQTKSLQTANDAMRADVDNVQQAQTNANRAIETVRVTAATAVKTVHDRTFTTGTPTAIQLQVNKEMSDTFKQLEAISRAQ